jgi:anti-sigma factor RsiW
VLDGRNVAAIVYQRRKHYINLFIWPATQWFIRDHDFEKNGYRVICWSQNGMDYMAVSEIGFKELQDFTGMIKSQTFPPLE